jgi:hypothetical protein
VNEPLPVPLVATYQSAARLIEAAVQSTSKRHFIFTNAIKLAKIEPFYRVQPTIANMVGPRFLPTGGHLNNLLALSVLSK